jgi:hypothetical protein
MRGWWWCALLWVPFAGLCAVSAAWGETFQVDAMKVLPDVAWQRGEAEREENESLYLLRWPGEQAMEVAIARRATVLKNDAESFLYHLGKIWSAQYGRHAEIDEVKLNDRKWLVCRRPSADKHTRVFQFATVHEGRAYSLVAFVPRATKGLPKPIYELVRSTEFQASRWRVERTVTLQPGREALAALAELDAERLGKAGLMTGYGADYRGDSLDWFIEGFAWREGTKERLPFESRGHVQAVMPARASDRLAPSFSLSAGGLAGVAVETRLFDLCAPPAALDDALSRLERGARAPLEKLQRERPETCPPAPAAAAPQVLQVPPGQTSAATFEFALPPVWPSVAGMQRAQIVMLKLRPAADSGFGENLVQALGLYVVYRPE